MPDDPDQAAPAEAADRLTHQDWTGDLETERRPGLRADISNAVVGLKKQYYGKGPTKANTYIRDNFVFCVLQGGLTRNEETLVAAGEDQLVRQYRLRFQEAMAETTKEAIERLTGRTVVGYHSQIVFDPEYGFEIFVLDGPPG